MSKKACKLVIDRKMWLNGNNSEFGSLRVSEIEKNRRKMCCLGFYLKDQGVPTSKLTGCSMPGELETVPEQCKWLLTKDGFDSKDCCNLTTANDDKNLSLKDRETKVKDLFAKHNVQVKFVN